MNQTLIHFASEVSYSASFHGVFAILWGMLAEGEVAPAAEPSSLIQQLVNNPLFPIAGVMLIFYFVLIAPERRRREEEALKHAGIKKNDQVVTSGGLHGKVTAARSDSDVVTVQLDDAGNVRVKVSRWALTVIEEKKPEE